jgi:isopenicillin-N epimerase
VSTPLAALFLLDPAVHYLNHGSFGACPRPVFETYQAWQRRLETQPTLFLGRQYHDLLIPVREALGAYLNVPANNLACIPNVTYGVNLVARTLTLNPGDEILTSDHEYGACDYAWEFVCQKSGAAYLRQPIRLPTHSREEMLEQFWQGVTPRTKVIYLSHISSYTALHLPIEAVCARAREVGILTVIDGAHAPGQIPLDLAALDADVYTGNCHKWMMSPKGAGFLYVQPWLQPQIQPLVVSWGYQSSPQNSTGSQFQDYLTWTGTHDPAAYLSIPAAIAFMQENDWEGVRLICHAMLMETLERIHALTGLQPMYPPGSDLYHQMAVAPLPPDSDTEHLKTLLYEDYQVEVPMMEWNGHKFLRISVQGYNTQADLDALVEGLETLLR